MKENHKDITSVLEDFCGSYKDLKELNNALVKVLNGKIKTVKDEDADDIALKICDDKLFIDKLVEAVDSGNPVSALRIYSECIIQLRGAIASKTSTVAKLSDRILRQSGTPEAFSAARRRTVVNDAIKVLEERLSLCAKRYYATRRSILLKVVSFSKAIDKDCDGSPDIVLVECIKGNGIDYGRLAVMDGCLRGCDE